jgi:hypothetical protein
MLVIVIAPVVTLKPDTELLLIDTNCPVARLSTPAIVTVAVVPLPTIFTIPLLSEHAGVPITGQVVPDGPVHAVLVHRIGVIAELAVTVGAVPPEV